MALERALLQMRVLRPAPADPAGPARRAADPDPRRSLSVRLTSPRTHPEKTTVRTLAPSLLSLCGLGPGARDTWERTSATQPRALPGQPRVQDHVQGRLGGKRADADLLSTLLTVKCMCHGSLNRDREEIFRRTRLYSRHGLALACGRNESRPAVTQIQYFFSISGPQACRGGGWPPATGVLHFPRWPSELGGKWLCPFLPDNLSTAKQGPGSRDSMVTGAGLSMYP